MEDFKFIKIKVEKFLTLLLDENPKIKNEDSFFDVVAILERYFDIDNLIQFNYSEVFITSIFEFYLKNIINEDQVKLLESRFRNVKDNYENNKSGILPARKVILFATKRLNDDDLFRMPQSFERKWADTSIDFLLKNINLFCENNIHIISNELIFIKKLLINVNDSELHFKFYLVVNKVYKKISSIFHEFDMRKRIDEKFVIDNAIYIIFYENEIRRFLDSINNLKELDNHPSSSFFSINYNKFPSNIDQFRTMVSADVIYDKIKSINEDLKNNPFDDIGKSAAKMKEIMNYRLRNGRFPQTVSSSEPEPPRIKNSDISINQEVKVRLYQIRLEKQISFLESTKDSYLNKVFETNVALDFYNLFKEDYEALKNIFRSISPNDFWTERTLIDYSRNYFSQILKIIDFEIKFFDRFVGSADFNFNKDVYKIIIIKRINNDKNILEDLLGKFYSYRSFYSLDFGSIESEIEILERKVNGFSLTTFVKKFFK